MKYFLMAVLLVVPVLAAGAGESDWRTFTSEAGGFTILMPGIPTFSETTDHTVVGAVVQNLYSLKTPRASFSAEYSNLPGIATFFDSVDAIYDDVKEGLLKRTGARLLSYYGIEQDGIMGKEMVYEIPAEEARPGHREKARFLLNDERLHVLVVTLGEEEEMAALVSRYLDSFHFIK